MNRKKLKSGTFFGYVVDNDDPKRQGRCKVKVFQIFDDFDEADIPWATSWKDLNGNEYNVPEIGKLVTVVFDRGNIYNPEYIYAQNLNINLENKIKEMSMEDYVSMRAALFDHATQIYRTKSEGLKFDHEFTNITLDAAGNIQLNIRDNQSVVTLGSADADEKAVFGTTFFEWMDEFVRELASPGVGAYIDPGAGGAPLTVGPQLATVLLQYQVLRERFLSTNVMLTKDNSIIAQKRPYLNVTGDGQNAVVSEAPPQPKTEYYNDVSGQVEEFVKQKVKKAETSDDIDTLTSSSGENWTIDTRNKLITNLKTTNQIVSNNPIDAVKLRGVAEAELARWENGKFKERNSNKSGTDKEKDLWSALTKYGCNEDLANKFKTGDLPWSAYFISWLVSQVDNSFPNCSSGASHYKYCVSNKSPAWNLFPLPNKSDNKIRDIKIKAQIGDILVAPRKGDYYYSHGDVVYKIEGKTAFLIGGNLSGSVKNLSIDLDENGYYESPISGSRAVVSKLVILKRN